LDEPGIQELRVLEIALWVAVVQGISEDLDALLQLRTRDGDHYTFQSRGEAHEEFCAIWEEDWGYNDGIRGYAFERRNAGAGGSHTFIAKVVP